MPHENMNIKIKKIILQSIIPSTSSSRTTNTIFHDLLCEYSHLKQYTPALSRDLLNEMVEYIYAYLDLGFSYIDLSSLFDSILYEANVDEYTIQSMRARNQTIACNKCQIRALIGKWPSSPYNSHTITTVIDDIMNHVKNENLGTYTYYTAKKDGNFTALYILSVTPEHALFHDVFRNKYYYLVKK